MRFTSAALTVLIAIPGCAPPPDGLGDPADFLYRGKAVHPGAVQLLVGHLADPVPVITAVDLDGWGRCNDFGPATTLAPGCLEWRPSENEVFGYQHIGRTRAGTHVLTVYHCGGGSGIFERVLLVRFEEEWCLRPDNSRNRVLLKAVGGFFVGDREGAIVTLTGNKVTICPGQGSRASLEEPIAFYVD